VQKNHSRGKKARKHLRKVEHVFHFIARNFVNCERFESNEAEVALFVEERDVGGLAEENSNG
jgi:hypothetical protein